jgi:DNA replication protein DnaC
MLEAITEREAILALRPLWANTPLLDKPREPNPNDPEDVLAQGKTLSQIYFRIEWKQCPDSVREWNILHPSGVCIGCHDDAVANEQKQTALGIYLRKTIGVYGIERYSFENFVKDEGNEEALEAMEHFDHHAENLFLYGSCGTGKTHLGGAVLKKSAASNLSVAWLQPLYVGRTLRSKFPSEEEEIIESWVGKDVCIVDDLGVGRDLDVTLRMIYELLDKRRARKRNGLIICSNHSLDTLAKAYKDDRIASRIAGMCRILKIHGADRRLEDKIAP